MNLRGSRIQLLLWALVGLALTAGGVTTVFHFLGNRELSNRHASLVQQVADITGLEARFRAVLTRREVCVNALLSTTNREQRELLHNQLRECNLAIQQVVDALSSTVGTPELFSSVAALRATNDTWRTVNQETLATRRRQQELAAEVEDIERKLDMESQAFLNAVHGVQGHLRLREVLAGRELRRLVAAGASSDEILALAMQTFLGDAARLTSRIVELEEVTAAFVDTAHNLRLQDDPQIMVSLRDNRLVPTVRRLATLLTGLDAAAEMAPEVASRLVDARQHHARLTELMLGGGWKDDPAAESIEMGAGGFYDLRSRELALQPKFAALSGASVEAHGEILRATDHLADDINRHVQAQTEQNRAYALRTTTVTLMIGGTIALVFVLLAGIVSLLIQRIERQERRAQQTLRLQSGALEHAANAIMITNRQGLIEWVNPAFTTLTRYAPEEVIGRNPRLLSSGRHGPAFYGELRKTITAGRVWHGEIVNRRKDGSLYHEEMTIAPIRDERSNIDHFVAIKQDVSSRVAAEKELRRANDFQRMLIDTAATAVFVIDTDQRIISVNEAFCQATGYSREEVVGRSCEVLNGDPCHESCGLFDPSRTSPIYRVQCTVRAKDGRQLTIIKNADVLRDDEGRVSGGVESFVDVTELDAARRAAESANEAKSAFLANMSHELRTPLHGILSFAGFGLRKHKTASESKLRDYFTKIKDSGETLLRLLNDLLDLAKLEVGRMRFEFQPARLDVQVASVVDEFAAQLNEHRLVVQGLEEWPEATISFDVERIKQVVRNLLSNAVKFSHDNAVIEIRLEATSGQVVLSVRDHGVGIPEGELETVFDKFVQSSKTHSGAGGTGLGLSICREIVLAHGGRIWAEHNPGGGSVFFVRLPVQTDSERCVETVSNDASNHRTTGATDERAELVGGTTHNCTTRPSEV